MPRLVNAEINALVEQLSTYQTELSKTVYDQFKQSLILSQSNNIKGKTGDAFKSYMELVHINLAKKIINVSAELLEAAEKMKTDFVNYEGSTSGIVGTGTLDEEKRTIEQKHDDFDLLDKDAIKLVDRASEFISTTKLCSEDVGMAYEQSVKKVKKTKADLLNTDNKVKKGLSPLAERVKQLKTEMHELSNYFRDENGIVYGKAEALSEQDWYSVEKNGAFDTLAEDDPFIHAAGNAAVSEGQWVAGTSDTNYLSATGYVLGANGQFTYDNGKLDTKGEFAAARGNVKGETLYGYIKGDAQGELLAGQGSVNVQSWDDFKAEGSASVAKAEGTAMLGADEFNGYASAKASALTADGKATFKTSKNEDDHNSFALSGHASAAEAKAEAGVTILGIKDTSGSVEANGTESKVKSILGASAEVSAGAQVGAGIEYSDEVVFKTDYVNIRATQVAVDLKVVLGLKFDVQMPTVQLKWPW